MNKLRNLIDALSMLNDWKEEVERAYQKQAENEEKARAARAEAETMQERFGKKAVVLDLAAYRAMKVSA